MYDDCFYYVQVQCYLCGEDSQGVEGAEASQSHQPSQRTEGTGHASVVQLKKIIAEKETLTGNVIILVLLNTKIRIIFV